MTVVQEEQECTTCLVVKHKSEFSLRSTITGQRHKICKECHKKVARRHYKKDTRKYINRAGKWSKENPSKRKKIALESAKKISREQKRLAVEYKGGKCVDCNGVFHQSVYDFHHVNPSDKDYHVSTFLSARGFEAAKEELDKCVLLCCNCHRIRHYNE